MEIRYWGGVAVVWTEDKVWQVEVIINFGPNVASFLLSSRLRRWYVVRSYVPPNDAPDVHNIEQELEVAEWR